jgi:nucleotide-binding universal stress UspA family protein
LNIKKILVPVDFSECSNKAVDFALHLGEKFNAHITLLHVVTLFHEDVNEDTRLQDYEKIVQIKEQWINGKLKEHQITADQHKVNIESVLLRGFTASDKILEYIQENNFDLVVIGSHGRTGIKHFLQGSISEKVVRLSNIPVLTIHHSTKKYQPEIILVPIDFSKFSKIAVEYALFFCRQFHSKIIFLHIIEQVIHPAFYAASIESVFQVDPELKQRTLKKLAEFVNTSEVEAEYLVLEGKAYIEIVDTAKERNVDLVVMATQGLTGLDYFLMGSTAERVVRMTDCSVLTIARSENNKWP